jgi:hypothetical protein
MYHLGPVAARTAQDHGGDTMDTTTCPQCGAPAEVIDRFVLESTDGPIEHVRVHCVARHWFLASTASLARYRAAATPPMPAPRTLADAPRTLADVRQPAVPRRPRPARRSP